MVFPGSLFRRFLYWEMIKRSGAGLFPLAHAEEQINDEPHEGHRGHQPPQGLVAGGHEILLGHIEDGPTVPMKNGMHAARKIKVGSRSSMLSLSAGPRSSGSR